MLYLALLLAAPDPQDVAARLIGGALSDGQAYAHVADLTETIGPRLSGSAGAAAAVKWGEARMREDGLAVRLEPVKVPHWVRGEERGEILPGPGYVGHPLSLVALGGSVGTAQGGVTGEVVELHSLAEIAALGEKARGKILFLNHTMGTKGGYGDWASLRAAGPADGGKVGAAAVLVRSLATASLRSPHTGATSYESGVPKVPAAAISTEDAEMLHRLLERGPVQVKLVLGCRILPDADSFNVVGELRGREKPDEVVLLGAHLDSWDLATGATDDAAGVGIVMEAGRLIAKLGTAPRRTLRVVLFMNEENGLAGGKAYAVAHDAELRKHQAALEADSGAGAPQAVQLHAGEGAARLLRPWLEPLSTLGLSEPVEGEAGGADLSPQGPWGVPMLSIQQDTSRYFETHHSYADTLDKVPPEALARTAAAVAVVAYALAEMPETLPRPAPSEPKPGSPTPQKAH